MIHPLVVYYSYEDHTLNFTELLDTDFFFFLLVYLLEVVIKSCLQVFFIHVGKIFFGECQWLEVRSDLLKALVDSFEIPFFRELGCYNYRIYYFIDQLLSHRSYVFSQIFSEENSLTFAVYDLTLLIHNVVILEDIFSDAEVLTFHLLLSIFDLLSDHTCFDGFIFFYAQSLYHGLHSFAAEESHKLVLHTEAELCLTRVSLSSGTTSELVIDTS